MNRTHPVEALLRPPVELWSAAVALLAAIIALLAPWALLMTPGVALGCAVMLMGLALWRGYQGLKILRYQHHLRRLPRYTLTTDRIPVSRHQWFLGRGFRWTQTHAQRLRDTLRPEVQHYLRPGPLYRWARRREIAWEGKPILKTLAHFLNVWCEIITTGYHATSSAKANEGRPSC